MVEGGGGAETPRKELEVVHRRFRRHSEGLGRGEGARGGGTHFTHSHRPRRGWKPTKVVDAVFLRLDERYVAHVIRGCSAMPSYPYDARMENIGFLPSRQILLGRSAGEGVQSVQERVGGRSPIFSH